MCPSMHQHLPCAAGQMRMCGPPIDTAAMQDVLIVVASTVAVCVWPSPNISNGRGSAWTCMLLAQSACRIRLGSHGTPQPPTHTGMDSQTHMDVSSSQ